MTPLLAGVLALITLLGVVMGFRDAPNAVALAVRYRSLTPRVALVMSALLNTVGAALGLGLAGLGVAFIGHVGTHQVGDAVTVGVAVAVTIGWGILLWWHRMPGSSTHALLAALAGAAAASQLTLGHSLLPTAGDEARTEVVLGLLLSPALAWGLTQLLTPRMVRLGTTGTTVTVQHRARIALAVSAGAAALGHGVQTGQRLGMLWVITTLGAGLAADQAAGGHHVLTHLPDLFLVSVLVFSLAVGVGTLGGAWRIARTLTERLVQLDPLRAAVASAVPAVLLFVGSLVLHLPLSSTHTVTAGIVGAGQTQTFASVRWGQVLRVAGWWLLTPLGCAGVAFLATAALLPRAA